MEISKNENTFKILSIQVSLNGLCFCILDGTSSKITFFKRVDFEKQLDPVKTLGKIELEYEKEPALNEQVDEVRVHYVNTLFSLVPAEQFDEDHASSYLKFNTKILQTDYVAYDRVGDEMVTIFIPYTNITNYFFDRYGEFEYNHGLSILLKQYLQKESKSGSEVFIHDHKGVFDLVVVKDGKLQLANMFEYETKEDFLYYVLFCFEQLQLSTEEVEVKLSGRIAKNDGIHQLLWEYIRNVSFTGPYHNFTIDEEVAVNEQFEYLMLNSLK